MKKFPYRCKEHPLAQVKHIWDEDYITQKGNTITRNEKFECSVCGKQLARNRKEARCFEE